MTHPRGRYAAPTVAAVAVAIALMAGCSADGPQARTAELRGEFATAEATSAAVVDSAGRTDVLAAAPVSKKAASTKPALGSDLDVDAALAHVRRLSEIGVRQAGSDQEREAAQYIAAQLKICGYLPNTETFVLPNGRESRNVVATKKGVGDARIVVGAHMDSKAPSPGANDNASGVAAMLAIAEALVDEEVWATVEFVAFGSEEMVDSDPDHHHYGSRFRVLATSSSERDSTVAMFSVDMIGYGSSFNVRTMRRGPQTLSDDVLDFARERGVEASFKLDSYPTGLSDHEPYELVGIPAACVAWREDPAYHTGKDTAERLTRENVRIAGQLVLDYVRAVDEEKAERLR
ncbi:MAG: M28 family peptidase [Coriobacteriia bacterium]|nr:M28 family peptidase [Coriobacteriia bacterium]